MHVEALGETVEPVAGVHLATLAHGDKTSVQYFEIEPGAEVPTHRHHHEQVGFIFEGTLTFLLEDGEAVLIGPNESYAFAGDEPHGAENRGSEPVIGVDVFSPPRTDPDWAR